MYKEELLRQLYEVITNGDDIEKVKVEFKNGEQIKIDFSGDDIDEEDEDEDEDEDDDDDDDDDEVEVEAEAVAEAEAKNENNGTSHNMGQKVNVINS